jgi:hypothetical protein
MKKKLVPISSGPLEITLVEAITRQLLSFAEHSNARRQARSPRFSPKRSAVRKRVFQNIHEIVK